MKQKDIAIIIIIIVVSGVIALFASNALFASPKNRQEKVEVVPPLTADFPTPDSKYFNKDAFDPTRSITIGEGGNTNPFTAGTTTP